TDKDRADAHFALGLGVDWLALSFVRRPWDVTDLQGLIKDAGHNTPVIAKIEKPEAIDALDEILEAADGLMVARGDLGVEVAPEVEGWQWLEGAFRSITAQDEAEHAGPIPLRLAVARAMAQLSRDLQVRAVAVRTRNGISAAAVSSARPAAPVVALTMSHEV